MIRDAFLRAWTYEAASKGRVNAVSAERSLRGFLKSEDAPSPDDPIWSGWLIAIADLGYSELMPLSPGTLSLRDEFWRRMKTWQPENLKVLKPPLPKLNRTRTYLSS
jgi:hypothetical protein